MRRAINVVATVFNVLLAFALLYRVTAYGLATPHPGWEYKDLITIILIALSALLAALAIFIGLLAIWGYTSIREAAISAAEAKADESAKLIAESVAARTAEEVIARYAPMAEGDALTAALSDRGDK